MKKNTKIFFWLQVIALSIVLVFTSMLPMKSVFALDNNQTENTDIVRTLSLSYLPKGGSDFIQLMSPYKITDSTKIDKLHAKYDFEIQDNINGQTGESNRTIKSGNYYLINLPEKIQITNPTNGVIIGNHDRAIANYSFVQKADNSWQVKVEFTDYVDDLNEYDIHGLLEFDFTLDISSVGEGTSTTISIPIDNEKTIDIDVTKPVPPPTKPVSLTKTVTSYNNQTRELVWNVKMMPDIGIFSGCVFTDTIDINRLDLKSIKHGSVTLVQGVDYTYDSTTGQITYTIPNGRDGVNFQNIVITTVAKRNIYGNLTATTISNQANLSGGTSFVGIDSNTASQTITPNWLGKSGTLYQGNKIMWTLEANITNQAMYNAVITDRFQADVVLDKTSVKLGSTVIAVYNNFYVPAIATEVYGIYTANPDGTSELKIYLPRNKVNTSNAKQTITLVTNVVSHDSVVGSDPVYNNTASLDANYIADGDSEGTLPTINLNQTGVTVPYISVVKGNLAISADDKRNGTINWTISAASNLTDYGKSQIVDTLPADQDYIADEIYWGNQKINDTTEPKAEISADGRTLTITFNNNNALWSQQVITVKTKIKQEVYGTNINRDFTNQVRSALFSSTTGQELDFNADTHSVRIQNTVISKSSSAYNGNDTKQGQNPRVNFSIVINNNLMPLEDVIITDDLSKIITEFKKSGESSFNTVSGVKWTLVPNTLKITKNAGVLDSFDLSEMTSASTYVNDIINVDFGSDLAVNDKYTLTFTAELDVSQNALFKQNGTIRCKGNIANIVADGLKSGTISTPATGNSNEVKNDVLSKSGVNLVAEQQVLWSINLNQHKVTLDSARVEDILPLGITLDPTSIKLYKNVIGTDGNFVTGNTVVTQGTEIAFTYTYLPATGVGMEGRYTITVDLPDKNTDYILRFATDIDRSLLGKQISNSAYYVGETSVTQNTNTSIMILSSVSGGGSTTKSSVTVNKLSKDNGMTVNGAVFRLNWLRNGNPGDPVFVRTLTATNGSVIFRGLTRGEIYTVTETSPPNGYLLDNPIPITVVTPLTGTGDATPVTFYNTPVKTGSWLPAAIKKLDGKSIIHNFPFAVDDGTNILMMGTTQTALVNGDYTVAFAMNGGINPENIMTFTDDHTFNDTDPAGTSYAVTTKTFNMYELPLALSGYESDTKVYPIKLKIYNVKGQDNLKVVIEDENGNKLSDDFGRYTANSTPVFLNTYRANGSIQLSAEKILVGHALASDQFSFELYEGSTLLQTVKNGMGALTETNTYTGNVTFNVINYTQADVGTKTYRIIEKNTSLPGYTYDTAEYIVTVKIDDNDNGTLTSSIQSIQKKIGSNTSVADSVNFTNTYTTSDLDVNLTATKTLSDHTIADNQFSFKLSQVDSSGVVIHEIGTVKNTGASISLPKLTFKQSDTGNSYYYQISEINDARPGYTYDDSVYTVKIEITDNDNGTISATQTITKSDQLAASILFANSYHALGKTTISATKTLTGKLLPDSQFSFSLQQFDNLTGRNIGTPSVVRNNENGEVVFPELIYTQDDVDKTFIYTVKEINDAKPGYEYAKTVYFITVIVTDNGDGTLNTKVSLQKENGSSKTDVSNIVFVNKYQASITSFIPNTGDHTSVLWYVLLISLSFFILLITKQRKRSRDCLK